MGLITDAYMGIQDLVVRCRFSKLANVVRSIFISVFAILCRSIKVVGYRFARYDMIYEFF